MEGSGDPHSQASEGVWRAPAEAVPSEGTNGQPAGSIRTVRILCREPSCVHDDPRRGHGHHLRAMLVDIIPGSQPLLAFFDQIPEMCHHDIEEFKHIIERYGFWNYSLLQIKPALTDALQIKMPIEIPERGAVIAARPEMMDEVVEE